MQIDAMRQAASQGDPEARCGLVLLALGEVDGPVDAARSIELLGPDMRVLGAAEGLPPLPDITYYLWTRREPITVTTQQVYEMLKTNMGLNESGAGSR